MSCLVRLPVKRWEDRIAFSMLVDDIGSMVESAPRPYACTCACEIGLAEGGRSACAGECDFTNRIARFASAHARAHSLMRIVSILCACPRIGWRARLGFACRERMRVERLLHKVINEFNNTQNVDCREHQCLSRRLSIHEAETSQRKARNHLVSIEID